MKIPATALLLAALAPAAVRADMEMEGVMTQLGPWHVMAHGFANGVVDHQGGPRGGDKTFGNSMLMVTRARGGPRGAARDALARSADGPLGISAALPGGREHRWPDHARRPPASPRCVHGALGPLHAPGRRGLRPLRLRRPAGRARAGPRELHAPRLRRADPRGAARPPLARLDAHHDGCRHARGA